MPNTPESLGLVLDFLSRRAPFDRFPLGLLAATTRLQLRYKLNCAAYAGGRVVGYTGWHPTTIEAAERWEASDEPTTPVLEGDADACFVTAFASDNPQVVKVLIKALRDGNQGRRLFYQRLSDPEASKRKVSIANGRPQ